MRAAPRFFLGLFAAAAASLGVTASASAALSLGPVDLGATVQNVVKLNVLGTCGAQDTSAVFRPWGDFSQYVLAPNGDFAATGDWALDGDAQLVTSASPRGNGRVLSLGDDGEAVSPITCLSVGHPTIRLFARNTGAAGSKLQVSVLMRGSNGTFTESPVATLTAGSAWNPTPIVPVVVNLFALTSADGALPVSFRFKAVGAGAKAGKWQLDDLYVDPFKGH
jgi:hypothetical protein